jgi:hypothetical protein
VFYDLEVLYQKLASKVKPFLFMIFYIEYQNNYEFGPWLLVQVNISDKTMCAVFVLPHNSVFLFVKGNQVKRAIHVAND